jgi:peptidoglycan/LPS O-acetylase OafA/YrhL
MLRSGGPASSGPPAVMGNDTAGPSSDVGDAISYRPDVDGLRAIAIIPVVAFHAGFSGLPGGFTGVDVFFVISGYLIGAQIFRQSTAGTFSYLSFYARRLRRIVPALIALLLLFFSVGYFLLTPSEMRELGKESVAAVFGASNFLFFMGGDYFAPAADLNPLLHTWSLGVEEQFYIVLPILAVVLIRLFKARAPRWLLAITILTFVASVILTNVDSSAAFYLLPTRFWELSLGALLATSGLDVSTKVHGRSANALGFCGATLVVVGIVAYQPAIAFPGVFVLLPTVGAAMLIVGRSSWVNRLALSNPVVVFIGKISYSWYLWHWPLFYLARVLGLQGHVQHWVLALTSLVLAIGSWRFIEQPFRRRRLKDGRTVVCYVAVILTTAALSAVIYQQDGFPSRLPASARASAEDARRTQDDPCLLRRGSVDVAPSGCQHASTDAPTLVVVGDSHGASISPGFARAASERGLAFRQMTKSLCTGQFGYANLVDGLPDFPAECLEYQARALETIANDPQIKVVVLASRWSLEQELKSSSGSDVVDLRTGLESTLTELEKLGRQVVLVQDVPAFTFDPYSEVIGDSLPARARLRSAAGVPNSQGSAELSKVENDDSRGILEEVAARHPNVTLFDPWAQMCDSQGCRFQNGDDLYYFDNQHLTAVGAYRAVGAGPPV